MINSIDAIQQQNIYRVNAVNLFDDNRSTVTQRANRFDSGLFAQQTNDVYNPNHPMVKSSTNATQLDLLA